MVQQQQINDYFSTNHDKLKSLATYYLSKRKVKFIEVDALISHAYLNITEKISSIKETDIEPYTINFIKCHCKWKNKTTTEEQIKERNQLEGIELVNEDYNIEQEIKHQAIEQVYSNEKDQCKKIIYDVFFTKQITTVRGMAAHFNISHPSAHELIKQLKRDINEQFKIKSRIYEQNIRT